MDYFQEHHHLLIRNHWNRVKGVQKKISPSTTRRLRCLETWKRTMQERGKLRGRVMQDRGCAQPFVQMDYTWGGENVATVKKRTWKAGKKKFA